MPVKQGGLNLLLHPVSLQLLESKIPARLAYVWTDGTPRVVPIWFHWNGSEFVMGSPAKAPKLKALASNPKVALTIDDNSFPHNVLLVRGRARLETRNGVVPEMPPPQSATSDLNKDRPGSRNSAKWCQRWSASPSRRSGWVCWIFKRDFPVHCRFDRAAGVGPISSCSIGGCKFCREDTFCLARGNVLFSRRLMS